MRNQTGKPFFHTYTEFNSLKRSEISQAVTFISSINKKIFPFIVEELMSVKQYEEETQMMIELSGQRSQQSPYLNQDIDFTKVLRINSEIVGLVIGIDFQKYFSFFPQGEIQNDLPNSLLRLGRAPNNHKKGIYVCRLCISEKYQGQGLATKLLKQSFQYFAEQGYEICFQRTISESSSRLFKKLGASVKGKVQVQFPKTLHTITFLGVELPPSDNLVEYSPSR